VRCLERIRGGRCPLLVDQPVLLPLSVLAICCHNMANDSCPLFQESIPIRYLMAASLSSTRGEDNRPIHPDSER